MIEPKAPIYNRVAQSAKTMGVVFGTFAPFHKGHYQEVIKSLSQNDLTVVIASGYADDRGALIGLPLAKRVRKIKTLFQPEPSVFVAGLDETDMPQMPNGWNPWMDALLDIMQSAMVEDRTLFELERISFYVGEPEYGKELEARFKDRMQALGNRLLADAKIEADALKIVEDPTYFNAVVSDRGQFEISATMIRNHPMEYFNLITKPFQSHFTKKIAVIGAPSTGKSTLIRRLSQTFNANHSEETAREFENKLGINDDDLTVDDYRWFVTSQHEENSKVIDNTQNGIALLDTTPLATSVYAKLYLSDEDFQSLKPLFDYYITHEHVDLILGTMPTGVVEDDGNRNLEWANDGVRFYEELERQVKEYGLEDKLVALNPISDDYTFYDRYQEAVDTIEELTGLETGHLTS